MGSGMNDRVEIEIRRESETLAKQSSAQACSLYVNDQGTHIWYLIMQQLSVPAFVPACQCGGTFRGALP